MSPKLRVELALVELKFFLEELANLQGKKLDEKALELLAARIEAAKKLLNERGAADKPEAEKIRNHQIETLNKTSAELMARIDSLNQRIVVEQKKREADVNSRALNLVINKLDQQILDSEETIETQARKIVEAKETYEENNKVQTSIQDLNKYLPADYAEIPEVKTYLNADAALMVKRDNFAKAKDHKSAEFKKFVAEREKLDAEFFQKTMPKLFAKELAEELEERNRNHSDSMESEKSRLLMLENAKQKLAKRRAELHQRLRRASTTSEEQKLVEDELQVLREFRKEVLRKQFALKLEADGIVLPTEQRK